MSHAKSLKVKLDFQVGNFLATPSKEYFCAGNFPPRTFPFTEIFIRGGGGVLQGNFPLTLASVNQTFLHGRNNTSRQRLVTGIHQQESEGEGEARPVAVLTRGSYCFKKFSAVGH